MTLDAWDDHDAITYDHDVLAELTTLRFVEADHNALILGPVGVGKTRIAHALGHIACRRRLRVHAERADRLFKRLKAARLDNSHPTEIRRLIAADLLVVLSTARHPATAGPPRDRIRQRTATPSAPTSPTSHAENSTPGGPMSLVQGERRPHRRRTAVRARLPIRRRRQGRPRCVGGAVVTAVREDLVLVRGSWGWRTLSHSLREIRLQ